MSVSVCVCVDRKYHIHLHIVWTHDFQFRSLTQKSYVFFSYNENTRLKGSGTLRDFSSRGRRRRRKNDVAEKKNQWMMSYGTRVQSIFYRANQCLNYAQLMLMTTYYSGFIADIFLFWLLFKFVFLPRTNIRYRSFSCSVVDWRCLYFRLAASRYFTSTNNAH